MYLFFFLNLSLSKCANHETDPTSPLTKEKKKKKGNRNKRQPMILIITLSHMYEPCAAGPDSLKNRLSQYQEMLQLKLKPILKTSNSPSYRSVYLSGSVSVCLSYHFVLFSRIIMKFRSRKTRPNILSFFNKIVKPEHCQVFPSCPINVNRVRAFFPLLCCLI